MGDVLVEKKYTDDRAYVYAEHYEDGKVRTTRYYGSGDVFLWESVDHYDEDGNFSGKTMTYSSGRIYEKDENCRDVRITYTSGEYVEYVRDIKGKVHYETYYDAGGRKLYEYEYIYDEGGVKTGSIKEYADGKAYHYDIDGYLTKEVLEGGYYFLYKDGYHMGRAVTTEYYEPDDTLTKTITYNYDESGDLLGRTVDYANNRVCEQDRYFRTDKITYSNGEYMVYTRHSDGRVDEATCHDSEENVLYRQVFNYDDHGNSTGAVKTHNTGLIEEFSPEWKLLKKTEANGVIYNYYTSGRVKNKEVPEEEAEGEFFGKRVIYHYRDEDTSGEYGRIERIDVIDGEVSYMENSLKFDGEDDYIMVADADELSCGDGTSCTPMSIVADIDYKNNGASHTILRKTGEYGFGIGSQGGLYFQLWDNTMNGSAGVAMAMGIYITEGRHQVAVTFNGTGGRNPEDVKLFVDGVQVEAWDIGAYIFETTENTDSDLYIGSSSWEGSPTGFWPVEIYDVKIYSEELSTGQIEDLSSRKYVQEGLLSHWDFSEGVGNILEDKVGGNDGVIHGALWNSETLEGEYGYYYENIYLELDNPYDITIDKKTKVNLTTETLIEEYDRLETLPDGTLHEFEYKVLSPRRRMVKETLPAGAYKEYGYWPDWDVNKFVNYFLPDGTLFMREGCNEEGVVDSTSLFHENGQLKEMRRTDSTWEEYSENGDLTRSGRRANDIEVIYDASGRIDRLVSGLYEEERRYVYSSEGIILYTLALNKNAIRAVKDGYYEGLDLISREYKNEMANAVTVTYDDHLTISYDGGEIKALSADDGYVNFYSGSDIIYQNSAFGDLYCFENGFLKRIATVSGNVYNFDKVYYASDVSVVLSGAVINGTVCEFTESNLSSLLLSEIQIDIREMILKNNLTIDILKIDRGAGEETLLEGDALYEEIESVLQTVRSDIPNIRFDYSPELAIHRILTSDHSEIFLEGDLISKIISTEGVEVVYEFIEESGEITGLRLLEEGVVRIFDKSGNLVSIEFPDGSETTTLTFEDGELDNITSADSVMKDITYTSGGDIDSARLMNPSGVEYFFTGGTLSSFLDSENVEYEVDQDGKVNRLIKIDTGEIFTAAYLLDPDDGGELAVFTQEGSRTKYIYKEGVLRTVVDPTGLSIDYIYDSEGRTHQIDVLYGGVRESTYSFEYGGQETIITDDVGNKRFFDDNNRAVKLETPYGDTYSYVYDVDINGDPITVVNYTEKDEDGGVKVQYFKGQIQRIDRPDGSWIDNVEFDPITQKLKRFSLHTPEGDHRNILMEGKFIQIEMEDATRLVFYENTLVAFANSQGVVPLYDIEGLDETIYLRDRTSSSEPGSEEIDVAASSWRHQTYEDSRAIRFVERDFVNEEWLVSLDLRTGDQEYSQGEMYLDLRYDIPGLEYQSPIDMRGKEISFLMQLGDGFEHDPNYPCNVQVFAKDSSWNTQYGTKVELVQTSGWIRVTLVPTEDNINFGFTDPGFDPSSIVMFGLRITEPDFAPSGKSYLGDVHVKHDILPNLFENVSYEESPIDDLYSGLGLLRDLDRLHEDPEVTDTEVYLESFVNALGDGPQDLFEESLLKSISWHPEEETTHINGVESVYRDTVTDEVVLNMDISSSSEDRTEGEVFFNVTSDVPGLNWNGPVNLTSRPLKMLIEVPQGMVGVSYAPTGARLFVEDENMNLQYGTWVNLKEGGKWYQLELTPTFGEVPMGSTDEGFDPSKIKKIGINFATQPNSGVDFMGEVRMKFLDGASDLDSGTTINTPLWMDLRNIKEYLVDENDNYIRVPFVNYLSESHFGYVFNQGSGAAPTANFEALEAHNTNWQTQYSGISSVGWDSGRDALVVNTQFSSYTLGELLLDVRYGCWVPDKNWQDNSSIDMSSQQVVFYVRPTQDVPVAFSVEAFAQSTSNWRIQYSEKVTVNSPDEWVKLVLTPSPTDFMGEFRYTQAGFDPKQIVGLGLKFTSSAGSGAYTGPVEVRYEVNDINLGVNDLGATDKLPTSPVWVNQRDLGSFLSDNEIALYGDYRIMEEVNRLVEEVPGYTLPSDFAAMTVFDENDKVSSISKPDGTTTYFNDNSQIDYIAFEDGSVFVDYGYDTSGSLMGATLSSAREKLTNAIGETVLEVEKKTTDTLLLLAEQHKLLEEDFMMDVNAQRSQFASARAGLEAQRYYEVEHWFLWWSWTERIERPEVVQAISDLNGQEAAFNRQVAEELAKLDGEISVKRDEIVAEKNIILEEYAWQEKKMFLAILHEEAIPIIYYYYRNVLGRDATQEEIEAILRRIDESNDFAGFLESDLLDLEIFTDAMRSDVQSPVYLALSEEVRLFVDGFSPGDTPAEDIIISLTKDLDDVIKTYDLYSILTGYYEAFGGVDALLSDGTKSYRDELTCLAKPLGDLDDVDKTQLEWFNRYILQDIFPGIVKKSRDSPLFSAQALKDELTSSDEHVQSDAFKTTIIDFITTFLDEYLSSPADRTQLLSRLGLSENEVIDIDGEFLMVLYDWLEDQDLHFGRSAFGTLKKMLDEKGVEVPFEDIAKEALLIDILLGITGPRTDKKIEISMYTMSRVANMHGVDTKSTRLEYDDILNINAPFITLVGGRHYVTVLSVTETDVTYWDKNIGVSGGEVTISRKDFEDDWQGNVITDASVEASKLLSDAEARKIKGAFFWFIIAAICSAIFTAVTAVITAAISVITTIIATLVTIVGQIGAILVNGVLGIGNLLSFAGQAFMGALGIGSAGSVAASGFTFGALVEGATTTLINVGVSYGMSVGLEALGVDPVVSGILSSAVTGGVSGLIGPNGSLGLAFKSAIQWGATASASMLGQYFDVDPVITSILSMSIGVLQGADLGPNPTFGKVLDEVIKPLGWELAAYGIQYTGMELGLDPGISYLAGIAIRSSLQMGFSSGGGDPGAWIDGAILGATQGITQIGLNYLVDELDLPPIVQQMGSQVLNSIVPGIASVFTNMYRSFTDNALTTGGKPYKSNPKYWEINPITGENEFNLDTYAGDMAEWSWQEQGYKNMAEDFTNHIQNQGFENAMNTYGVSLFDQESLNAIDTFGLSAGEYFQDKLDNNTFEMATLVDGVNVAKIGIEDNLGNNYGYAYFKEDSMGGYSDLYGYNYEDYEGFGDIFADTYGDLKFINGQITENIGDYVVNQMISNGMQDYIQFSDLYGEVVFGITPTVEGGNIYMLDGGSLIEGSIICEDGAFSFSNGELVYFEMDGVQFDLLSGDVNVTGLEGQNIDIEAQGWDIMDKIMSSYEEFGNLVGTPVAYADSIYETSDTIPEGKYAIRFFAARPTGLDYGADDKIGDTGDRTGHTFIALVDSHGNEIRRGLYPAPHDLINSNDPINALIANHVSDIRDDGVHHYHESTQWYVISASDYVEIQAYLDEDVYENTHLWYNLASNNCTDLALNVAAKLGIDLPYEDGAYSNPQSFANTLLEAEVTRHLGHSNFSILAENYLQNKTREVSIKHTDGTEETIILNYR